MVANQKEQAELLRFGLQGGARTVADVVAWADGTIEADPLPDYIVLELACCGRRSVQDVIGLLREVPGTFDPVVVRRRHLGELRALLRDDPARARDIAENLYRLACEGDLPEEEFGSEPFWLDDLFAMQEYYAEYSIENAIKALDEYLECHEWRPSE